MKSAIILIGLPASGKSTFRDQFPHLDPFIYSTDDVIEEIAKENNSTYAETFSDEVVKLALETANTRLAEAIEQGRNILWDQTNLGMYKRTKALITIPDDYYKTGYVFLPPLWESDYETLERRLTSREGKDIPKSVMIDMMDRYQMPTITEGFDDLIYLNPFALYNPNEEVETIPDIFAPFLAMREYVNEWKLANPIEEITDGA